MVYEQSVEKKAKDGAEAFQEMLPFFFYAAIPLIITITLALVFGPPY